MMKCIIIDDEDLPRRVLQQLIDNIPELQLAGSFETPVEALKFLIEEKDIELIFLDISMPHFSGFEFIQTLKKVPAVILVTAHIEHAVTAFEYDHVVDYLLKPVSKERLKKAVKKAKKHNQEDTKKSGKAAAIKPPNSTEEQELYIQSDKKLIKIKIPEIIVIQAKGNYILIKTTSGNYITYSSLKKIENKLPSNLFVRTHRAYLINYTQIVDIQDNSVLLSKEVVPVSRRYKPGLLKRINKL